MSYSVTNGSASGCSIPTTTLTATSYGTCNVTVTRAGDSNYNSATTGAVVVTFTNPTPTITFPTSGSRENPGFDGTATFTLTGTGFVPGVVFTGNGAAHVNSYTYLSSTQISVNVTGSGSFAATGTFTVTNPGVTGVTSQSGSFING